MIEGKKKPSEGASKSVPVYQEYMNPILDVLRAQGRAVPIEELDRLVVDDMKLPPDVLSVPHDPEKPGSSEVSYRMAWARTYLKKAGLADNPAYGRWAATPQGKAVGKIDAYQLSSHVIQASKEGLSELADDVAMTFKVEREANDDRRAARVTESLARELSEFHGQLALEGKVPDAEKVARAYRHFREVFGPEVLAGLDGQELLAKMHGRRTKDSLVYWLEFKNDDEFPAWFGSIGGGSSYKFGIFWALDAQQWTGSKNGKTVRLTPEEALAVARAQRDQMMAGARVLAAQPADPTAVDYGALQAALEREAPDLAETSWGHKYFSLLYPTIIDAFHSIDYQRHQLRKLLKVPSKGRYENARILVGVARQLGLSLFELAVTLNRRNGGPHNYWRAETAIAGKNEWDAMQAGGFASIGWPAVGDLSSVPDGPAGKLEIQRRLEKYYPGDEATLARALSQVYQFLTKVQAGDLMLATEGGRVRGIGRVAGGYTFQRDGGSCLHRRPVEWLHFGEWPLPQAEGLRTSFGYISEPLNIVETEARLVGGPPKVPSLPPLRPPTSLRRRLSCSRSRASWRALTPRCSASVR